MDKQRKVLLIEDDHDDCSAFERAVKQGKLPYQYTIATSGAEARKALSADRFDIVVTDYFLGDATALDLLGMAKDTPFILTSGSGDEAIAVDAMKKGVFDYLVKDVRREYLKILPMAIDGAIARAHMQRELKLSYLELEKIAAERKQLAKELDQTRKKDVETSSEERHSLSHIILSFENSLALIADELHTSLKRIRNGCDCLFEKVSSDDELLNQMRADTLCMEARFNDLVDMVRINNGTITWNWSHISLRDVCSEALSLALHLIDTKKVTLHLNVWPDSLQMYGDRDSIIRLIFNLVSHACTLTQEGIITVSASSLQERGFNWIAIEISDESEGNGSRFDLVSREDDASQTITSSNHHSKTESIHLVISRGIVEAHGGTLSVVASVGQGTSMSVHLRADLTQPTPSRRTVTTTDQVFS